MTKEQFEKDCQKAYKWLRKARKSCIEYIERVVKEHGGYVNFNTECPNEDLTIMYDGGAHPEYASNVFSQVRAVFIHAKWGYLCVECDDDFELEINRVLTVDVTAIAEVLYYSAIPRLENEK